MVQYWLPETAAQFSMLYIWTKNVVQFVKDNNLNDINKLRDQTLDPTFKPGAIEIKSAWIAVDETSPPNNYILADASIPNLIQDSSGIKSDPKTPRNAKLALLGIHVVFALENHPELIWATFEHVANNEFDLAPAASELPDKLDNSKPVNPKDFTLYTANTSAASATTPPDAFKLQSPSPPLPQTLTPSSPVYRRFPWSKQRDASNPADAMNEDDMVKSINENMASLFKGQSKFDIKQNYKLVGAVWIAKGASDFRAGVKVIDKILQGEDGLSNMAMESFTQEFNPNCFGCHQPLATGKIPAKRVNVSHIFPKFSQKWPVK